MNDLQKKSLELLRLFLDICNKWDIQYFLICGSALGAVKYEGFIPWDDDIDVGLPREEYERFLKIAQMELPDWCFLQNYKTEKLFPHTFSKLRNSHTTFIEKGDAALPINHGICIDIFPLDGHPKGYMNKVLFAFQRKVYAAMRFCILDDRTKRKIRFRNKLLRVLGCHKMLPFVQKRNEQLYKKYRLEESDLWCNYGNWQGKLEYAPKWHYGEGTWATFEGLRIRIPENYDAYLTQKYGDWRKDPPLEKQKTHHVVSIIDTEKSYKYYLYNNSQMSD